MMSHFLTFAFFSDEPLPAKDLASASAMKATFCCLVLRDSSALPEIVMTPFGPDIFNFMYVY